MLADKKVNEPKVGIMPGWYNQIAGISDAQLLDALLRDSYDDWDDPMDWRNWPDPDEEKAETYGNYTHMYGGDGQGGYFERRGTGFSRKRN